MATQKMLKFVSLGKEMPTKRDAMMRASDFHEIYREFAAEKAAEQASRCSQCGVPYCQSHCPLHNNIPDWLRLTAEGRLQEAYEISQATNTFPEICGRICPQDRLCEGNCVIEQSGHGTVTIGAVEKYLTDLAWENGWVLPITPGAERAESVGIIGAGPGGLAAADVLRRKGVQVTVYDRYDRAGGLLTYGIPGFKLEKPVVMQRIEQLEKAGVQFVMNCNVGTDISFDAIRGQHDAVLIATGVYKARDIEAPGVGLSGVVKALDYLTASNRKSTAIRQGAVSVKCLYRRDKANMPGSQREVQNAEEEGVDFVWLTAPRGFVGSDHVHGVIVQKMRLGAPDASGRQSPEIIEGVDYTEAADLVIQALGFEPEDLTGQWDAPDLAVTRWGTVKADFRSHATNLPGVYAAGDIVRGASLVVWAIRDGREAADAILEYLAQPAQVAAE